MIVVKAGGNSELDMMPICADVAELIQQGEQIILVHGGSGETNRISKKLGNPPRFVTSPSGHSSRHTDRKALEIYIMVVTGRINKLLVEQLQKLGVNALGLSGLDGRLLEAKRKSALRIMENGKPKVLRGEYSGIIKNVNVSLLQLLLDANYMPVVAPVAISYQNEGLNVDGDRAAAAIGHALGAEHVIILSNVPGLLRDVNDEGSVIPHIPAREAKDYLECYAKGRMKRKVLGAVEALQGRVSRVIIADGRVEAPIQRALAGQGTVFSDER